MRPGSLSWFPYKVLRSVGAHFVYEVSMTLALLHTYQLLIMRNQPAPLEVKATCAEEACTILKRSFMGADYGMVEFNMGRELQNTWLVMRTTPFEYCDFLHIESWDGQRFRSFCKADIGMDILSAVQACAPDYLMHRPVLEPMNSLMARA